MLSLRVVMVGLLNMETPVMRFLTKNRPDLHRDIRAMSINFK
jgi:hypothetical protein